VQVKNRVDDGVTTAPHGPGKRRVLLIWGLPRDPIAARHLMGFFITTVLTVVITRAALAATGFPQLGGEGLHIAHVLWGGLLQAVAVVLLISFAGPLIRPIGAFVGGVGFGLFIDEIGKFLTDDNDYFYEPAPALMYVTLVALVLGADWLHRRRPHDPAERLAGAADYAVAGLVGGLTRGARADAARLVELGREAPQANEVRALLEAIEHDDREVPNPIGLVADRFEAAVVRLGRGRWATGVTVALVVLSLAGALAVVMGSWTRAVAVGLLWFVGGALVSAAVSAGFLVWGLWRLAQDRVKGYLWLRRAVLVTLLVTQVAVFRFEPWIGSAGLVVSLVALGLVAAERWGEEAAA
jgi:hypothetical protein